MAALSALFQFHIGAIRRCRGISGAVRKTQFQFHIGAIRRIHAGRPQDADTSFQFHIGAIRRILKKKMDYGRLSFNSILVQLEDRADSG